MLLEGALVRASLRRMLTVHETVILFTILVGMGEGYLDVLAFEMDNGIEWVGRHRVDQQVLQSVAALDAAAVVHDRQTAVEIGIVAEHRLHKLVVERIVLEQGVVRLKEDVGTILVLGRLRVVALKLTTLKDERPHLSFTIAPDLETGTEGIDGLHAHTVQTHTFLEGLSIVFTTGIQYRYGLHKLTLRDATAIVTYRDAQVVLDIHLDAVTGIHLKLIDRVVDDLLEQDVDAVLRQVAIAQSSYIHARTCPNMLHVRQVSDVVIRILYCSGIILLIHLSPFYNIFYAYG